MTNLEWFRSMDACTMCVRITDFRINIVDSWLKKHNLGHIKEGWWDESPYAIDEYDAVEMWLNAEYEPWPGEEVCDEF